MAHYLFLCILQYGFPRIANIIIALLNDFPLEDRELVLQHVKAVVARERSRLGGTFGKGLKV